MAVVAPIIQYLFETGRSTKNSVTFTNEVIANSIFNVVSTCNGSINTSQFISVECKGPSESAFAANSGCLACSNIETQFKVNQNNFETNLALNNSDYVPKSFGDMPLELQTRVNNSCRLQCVNCIVEDVVQTNTTSLTLSCENDVNFESQLENQIAASVESTLTNKQDAISVFLSGFIQDKAQLSQDFANEVVNNFTTNIKNNVFSDMKSAQSVVIGSPTATSNQSFYVSNLQQSIQQSGILESVVRSDITSNLYNGVDFQAIQDQFRKNDTIGDIADTLEGLITGLADLFQSGVGKVMIIMTVIVAGIVVVAVILMAFNPNLAKNLIVGK